MITREQFDNAVTFYTVDDDYLHASYFNIDAEDVCGQIVSHTFDVRSILGSYQQAEHVLEDMLSFLYGETKAYITDLYTEEEVERAFQDAQLDFVPKDEAQFLLDWAKER